MAHSLDDFFASHNWELLHRLNGWTIRRDGDLVEFETSARDGERFLVLCMCDGYPQQAPEVVFINKVRDAQDPTAWPIGNDSFHGIVKNPPSSFLCMPLVRAGLRYHPEWTHNPRVKPWNSPVNSLMDIFNFIADILNSDNYKGRGR